MATWLLLSGHYTPLIIGFGIASCAIVVTIAHRMDVVDAEGHPIHLGPKALTYMPWLALEIIKANIDVTKRILSPTLDISPALIKVKCTQKSELGQVVYANSITLTPGTVAMDIDGDTILVHALNREAADGVAEGEMDRRVTAMEGLS